MRPPTPAGGPRRVYGSTPMVLPPPIVKLFSREARIFFEPYVFVKRHVKKITTPASKCCITFDQTVVRQQTGHQIEAHEVVYPMRCHVELSTWNTVAKRRNQDAEVFETYFFVKRHVKKITTPAGKCCITLDQTGVRQQTGHQIEAHEVVCPMGCHVELSTWNTVAKRRNQDAEVPPKKAERAKRPRLFFAYGQRSLFHCTVRTFFFF